MSAYLIYGDDKLGKLSLVWSKTPVEGALLEAIPKKTVAEFKYKTNRGATELISSLQVSELIYYVKIHYQKVFSNVSG